VQHSFSDLSALFGDVLADLDLVSTDVMAGLMLLKQARKQGEQRIVYEVILLLILL